MASEDDRRQAALDRMRKGCADMAREAGKLPDTRAIEKYTSDIAEKVNKRIDRNTK